MKATTHVKEKDWILDLSECDPACNAESAATRSLRTKAEAFISGENMPHQQLDVSAPQPSNGHVEQSNGHKVEALKEF